MVRLLDDHMIQPQGGDFIYTDHLRLRLSLADIQKARKARRQSRFGVLERRNDRCSEDAALCWRLAEARWSSPRWLFDAIPAEYSLAKWTVVRTIVQQFWPTGAANEPIEGILLVDELMSSMLRQDWYHAGR